MPWQGLGRRGNRLRLARVIRGLKRCLLDRLLPRLCVRFAEDASITCSHFGFYRRCDFGLGMGLAIRAKPATGLADPFLATFPCVGHATGLIGCISPRLKCYFRLSGPLGRS